MQLLFLTPGFPPFNGGGERYARSLALTLAGYGHAVTVVTSSARREQEFWRGTPQTTSVRQETDGPLNVVRCPLQPFPGGRSGLLLWRKSMVMLSLLPGDASRILEVMARRIPPLQHLDVALERQPLPDLVHGFNVSWEHTLVAGRRYARRRRRPYVVTPFTHLGEKERARVAYNSTMDHQRRILAQAQAVLALTVSEKDGLRHHGVNPGRVFVVGGGVEEAPPLTGASRVPARHGLQKPFALFVGRANYDKGAIHAAQAVLRLQQPALALVGHVTPAFERFYRRLSSAQQSRIRPLGVLDELQKQALLREAAMLLLPSRVDSFGIVLLEAWQQGTPVIGARAGGIPGVVDEGQDGLLVPFGHVDALAEAIRRLLTDDELRRIMGRRGQEKVKNEFTWDRVGQRVQAVYRRVLGGGQV